MVKSVFKIQKDPALYLKQNKKDRSRVILFPVLIFIVLFFTVNKWFALFFCTGIFIASYRVNRSITKSFISKLFIADNQILIEYFHRDVIHEVECDIKELNINKGLAWNSSRTPYILITGGNLELRQFCAYGWHETEIDNIIKHFKARTDIV